MYTIDYMKTATVNFKTDDVTKTKAQAVAKQIGIPLSNLLNAYLYELANTGSVHFTASEPMTEKMEALIEEAQKEIAAGEVSGPFESLEDMFKHLDSL
jgi:addiction module RelB/DinJ family antitoxin